MNKQHFRDIAELGLIVLLAFLVLLATYEFIKVADAQGLSTELRYVAEQKTEGYSTNPEAIHQWFVKLQNHQGGMCCEEADGYPAEITHEPTPTDGGYTYNGVAHITDTSAKDIYLNGVLIKHRPALDPTKNLTIKFSYRLTTLEKQGNPFDHAWVFLRANDDGSIGYVFCVVPQSPTG